MKESGVKAVFGTTIQIEKSLPHPFYKALHYYVDSKEKARSDSKKEEQRRENKATEFWPLINVMRIYTKADALSTGAVIFDLPGVHDPNAARAGVAAGHSRLVGSYWILIRL